MKTNFARAFTVAAFLFPALVHAHPGHDGDHGFGWDFTHLESHPYATFLCGLLIYAASWTLYRIFARPTPARHFIEGR